jgi:hypothetical protein
MVEGHCHVRGNRAAASTPRRGPGQLIPVTVAGHVLHSRVATDLHAIEPPFGRRVLGATGVSNEYHLPMMPAAAHDLAAWAEVRVKVDRCLAGAVRYDALQQHTRLQRAVAGSPNRGDYVVRTTRGAGVEVDHLVHQRRMTLPVRGDLDPEGDVKRSVTGREDLIQTDRLPTARESCRKEHLSNGGR